MPRQTDQQKSSEQIRSDAIKIGTSKALGGCSACADGYFELARTHGASEKEIRDALEKATSSSGKGLSRRSLIKLAAASGLTLGTLNVFTNSLQAASSWWGTDSNTQSCCQMPQNFYVGRMGYGGEPSGDGYYFNTSAAKVAGFSHTFGYWGLVGPGYRPSNLSNYDWGRRQATNAWNAWAHSPHNAFIGGYTIFGDVEAGFGGWTSRNYGPNQAILNGFCTELYNITPSNPVVWPGIYVSPNTWLSFFGSNFKTTTPFVLWMAGCDTCGGDICAPCNLRCNTLTTAQNRLLSTVQHVGLGGMRPVLWQYWIGDCNCGDYNIASQSNNSYSPIMGGAAYSHC